MNLFKRLFGKPTITWIVIDIDDEGRLCLQTNNDESRSFDGCMCDGPREFELWLTDKNRIAMRWEENANNAYQIEVDGSGIGRSLFDDAERLLIVTMPNELVKKEVFCWYKRKANNEGTTDYVQKPIPPEKLDNTYELYRIVYWFVRLCIDAEYDKYKMAATGTFYIGLPGTDVGREVLKRLFIAYLKQIHVLAENSQWDVVICDKVVVNQTRKSITITTKSGCEDEVRTVEAVYRPGGVIMKRIESFGTEDCPDTWYSKCSLFDRKGILACGPIEFWGL